MARFDYVEAERIECPSGNVLRGLVRRRGLRFGEGGRAFGFERRTPVAIVVPDGPGERRVELPVSRFNPLPLIAPVAGYLVVRAILHRRKPS